MIKIYMYGCTMCGVNAAHVRRIRAYGLAKGEKIELNNSKYSETNRMKHVEYLKRAGINIAGYTPVVVESNGTVTRLKEYLP